MRISWKHIDIQIPKGPLGARLTKIDIRSIGIATQIDEMTIKINDFAIEGTK